MPIDARIALGAIPQEYNAFGAMRQGQEIRQNQMAMQAAQDTAARAAAAREAARSVNFMDPTAGASFLSAYGADVAEPYLAAGARAAGTDVAQATGRRAQTTQDREGLDRIRGAWGRGLVSALADSSDTGLMTLRGRLIADGVPEAEVDETLAQLGAVDAAARPSFIRNLASTSEDARKAMEFVAPKPERINRGGTIVTVDMNPNSASYGQEIRVDTVTASPNRPQIYAGADGTVYSIPPGGGPAAPIPVAGGGNLTAPTSAAEERRQERREERAAVAERAAADAVSKANIALDTIDLAMDSTNWATAGLAGVFDWVPGSPPKRLAGYLNTIRANVAFNELQQMRRNSPTGGALGNVSDADMRLLQSTLATLDQQASPEDLLRALATIKRVTEAIRDAYAQDVRDFGVVAMGGSTPAPAGGADMPPVGARGATLTNSQTGATFVSDGTRWVPR
jgi:hypothetical protein